MKERPCDYEFLVQIPIVLTYSAHLPIYYISVHNQVKTELTGCWVSRNAVNEVSLVFHISL